MRYQGKSKRKHTGGRISRHRGKKKHEIGREYPLPTIGENKVRKVPTMGLGEKLRMLKGQEVNVTNPETGETERATIETVESNPANQHYERRNILTKGAILQTDKGLARVTSRPGQDGVINAVLVQEETQEEAQEE